MFKDLASYSDTFKGELFEHNTDPKKNYKAHGMGYKMYVDAYLADGDRLNNDAEYRVNFAEKLSKTIIDSGYKFIEQKNLSGYVDCELVHGFYSNIYSPLTNTKKQTGIGTFHMPYHVFAVLLLDGKTYNIDNTNFEPSSKIFRNEQWTWNSDKTVLSGEFDYSFASPVGKIYLTRIPKAGKERKEIEEYLENGYNGDVW